MAAEVGMKVEAVGGGEGAEEGGAAVGRARSDQLYMGGMKKPRRERLGCTTAKERISKMPPCVAGKRSSIYRGVTRHRWTGRYEAHLWDKSTWNQNQNKKGKQVYLGAYDDEEAAARAYDLAALKYWGAGTLINFPVSDYSRDLEEMQMVTKEDYLVSLRRKSSAFSRGFPKCRGPGRHSQSTRLETTSFGQMLGGEYCNSLNCSTNTDTLIGKKYAGGICMERKIDLTSYIRWWGPKRTHQSDLLSRSLDEKSGACEDINRELRALECARKPTEPYQMPSLGLPQELIHRATAVSASAVLSKSAAFKNMLQKISESCDGICNKEVSYEKPVQILSSGNEIERAGVSLGSSDLPLQRTSYTRSSLPSVPSRTNWNPVDPVPDAIFWNSLVPPPGLSMATTIRKSETTSYSYNCDK